MESLMVREGFATAAEYLVETVARVPADGWDRPGLGAWSIRSLVGHTSRSLSTVESGLAASAAEVETPDAAAYYRRVLGPATDHAALVARGEAAGVALGDDPVEVVRTPTGGMTLAAYLPTRVLELAIYLHHVSF